MINVTQEQKEFLNSLGIQVIEFKRQVMRAQKIIEDIMKAFAEAVKEVVEVVIKPLVEVVTRYLKSDKAPARDKYKLCKSLGIDYRPYIKRNQIYRCRNNC